MPITKTLVLPEMMKGRSKDEYPIANTECPMSKGKSKDEGPMMKGGNYRPCDPARWYDRFTLINCFYRKIL